MTKPKIKRLWIDENYCMAHGLCIQEAPEVFEFVEGKSVVQIKSDFLNYNDPDITEKIFAAADICPLGDVIKIELEERPPLKLFNIHNLFLKSK